MILYYHILYYILYDILYTLYYLYVLSSISSFVLKDLACANLGPCCQPRSKASLPLSSTHSVVSS